LTGAGVFVGWLVGELVAAGWLASIALYDGASPESPYHNVFPEYPPAVLCGSELQRGHMLAMVLDVGCWGCFVEHHAMWQEGARAAVCGCHCVL
jgi:hypothetical protein